MADGSIYDALMVHARSEPQASLEDAVRAAALYPYEAELAEIGSVEFIIQTLVAPCVVVILEGDPYWMPPFEKAGPARLELARHVLKERKALSGYLRGGVKPELTPVAEEVCREVVPTVKAWREDPQSAAEGIVLAMWEEEGKSLPMRLQPSRSEAGLILGARNDGLGIAIELKHHVAGARFFSGGSLYLPGTDWVRPISADVTPPLHDEISQLQLLN